MSSQHDRGTPPSDAEDPLSDMAFPVPPFFHSDPPNPPGASELQDARSCADSVRTTGDFDSLSVFPSELEGKIVETSETLVLSPGTRRAEAFAALEVQASPESLDNERVAAEGLRLQVQQIETAIKQTQDDVTALKADLDHIHHLAVELTRKYTGIEETTREAGEDAATVVETVKDIERRVGPLVALHVLSRNTDERLTALNGLAEEVMHKAKALEGQKDVLKRAVIEANRATEMMCALETRLVELRDHVPLIAHTETLLERIEQAAAQTTGQLAHATQVKDELGRDLTHFQGEAQALTRSIWRQVEQLAMEKEQFEGFHQHRRILRAALDDEPATAIASIDPHIEHLVTEQEPSAVTRPTREWDPRWLLRLRFTRALTMLLTQKTTPILRHRVAVISGLGGLVLVSFIVTRPSRDAVQIGSESVAAPAQQGALGSPAPRLSGSTFVCHTIRPGDTAALIARRLTGHADNYRHAWFYIVDAVTARVVPKARYGVIRPGWQVCIPETPLRNAPISQASSTPIVAQGLTPRHLTQRGRPIALAYVCWGIALLCLMILLGWHRAGKYVQKRRTRIGIMQRFGDVFVKAFERRLVRAGVDDRPIRARLRCALGQERLDILIAPADGRRYPNLGDHRQNVEYDVDRIVHDLRHEPFIRQPLYTEGSWVVIPFQFKPAMQKEGLL